ncbi:hypothetical protein F4806DRAFT_475909 [Annulohypoxylon nitens]|nr:hypothetical protein F4806DRAFT_475909 [Annulohypoxylon nitens]
MNNTYSTGYDIGSPTSTESSTLIPTPLTSRASSISQPSPTNIPPGPLSLTELSTTSWRQPYPSIGQFAMTDSEEVVAAGPDGLFYFWRVQDHAATPWTESRPFPSVGVTLNNLTVSGLALYSGEDSSTRSRLYLYCVSGGVLYSFCTTDKKNPSFLLDTSPPLKGCKIMGKPAVVRSTKSSAHSDRWNLVVPCQSGGLFHTSANDATECGRSVSTNWEAADHLATDLGIISAVSVTVVYTDSTSYSNYKTELVAVCISGGQLNVVQGPFHHNGYPSRWRWEGKASARILHPGEVTGNPVVITHSSKTQLDLLVPSAEGGIFHFVRTPSAPNDWHMIGRVAFPQNIPPASCLSFHRRYNYYREPCELFALIQICGRLYYVKTTGDKFPGYNAHLNPIVHPGPFFT